MVRVTSCGSKTDDFEGGFDYDSAVFDYLTSMT